MASGFRMRKHESHRNMSRNVETFGETTEDFHNMEEPEAKRWISNLFFDLFIESCILQGVWISCELLRTMENSEKWTCNSKNRWYNRHMTEIK